MIKRVTIPNLITLEDYCDENDLTIILTSFKNEDGEPRVKAELQGSLFFYVAGNEWFALIELAKEFSNKIIVINGKIHKFPKLRCH